MKRIGHALVFGRIPIILAILALAMSLLVRSWLNSQPDGPASDITKIDLMVKQLQQVALRGDSPIDPFEDALARQIVWWRLRGKLTRLVAPGIDHPLTDLDTIQAVLTHSAYRRDFRAIGPMTSFREGVGYGRQEIAFVLRIPMIGSSWVLTRYGSIIMVRWVLFILAAFIIVLNVQAILERWRGALKKCAPTSTSSAAS